MNEVGNGDQVAAAPLFLFGRPLQIFSTKLIKPALLCWLFRPFAAHAASRGNAGHYQFLAVTVFVLVTATWLALKIVKKKNISERPIQILTFAAYFWVIVFFEAISFAVLSALI